MGIFTPGINKGAYRGNLSCPVCASTAIRFIENIGPYRQRYRCRKCGLPFQYEIGSSMDNHPYAPLKKPIYQSIVDRFGRNIKEK
jgi:transposase-like protein